MNSRKLVSAPNNLKLEVDGLPPKNPAACDVMIPEGSNTNIQMQIQLLMSTPHRGFSVPFYK